LTGQSVKQDKRTFTEYSGTWLAGIHKKGLVNDYLDLMHEKKSLDKIKSALQINKKTAFDWRHKILSSFQEVEKQDFNGIIEFDSYALKAIIPYPWAMKSFVVKTNPTGTVLWAKDFGGSTSNGSMVIDANDNLYISGWFGEALSIEVTSAITFTVFPSVRSQQYLVKMDADGNTKWLKNYGGELMIDKEQNLYFAGSYIDSIYLDNFVLRTYIAKEKHNVYVAKADTNGHVVWAKKFCEGEHALLNGAINPSCMGDFFLAVFDNNMAPVWGKGFPKSSGQALKSVIADANENVYVVGDFCQKETVTTKSTFFTDPPTFIDRPALYLI